jgi:hypothetical protein
MVPWPSLPYCDALRRVHRSVRDLSQCSMYRARCPAKPFDAPADALAHSVANSGQIRHRCSGVEDDYNWDVCKLICPSQRIGCSRLCAIGDSAAEILARPAFKVSASKTSVELVAVSVAELGFQTDVVRLADIYARARQLGFGLASAEVAPQLRLQYPDQPLGEFLIAMEPINAWTGVPVILTVANFGAGLVLVGRDGSADAQIPVASRFLFVRSNEAALPKSARGLDEAAAFAPH